MPLNPQIPLSVVQPRFNSPFEVLQRYQQDREARELKRMQVEQQTAASKALEDERRVRMAEAEEKRQASIALSDAYKQAFDPQTKRVDPDKLTSILTQGGYGEAVPAILKGWNEAQASQDARLKARRDAEKADIEHAKALGAQMIASDFNPNVVDGLLTFAESQGDDVKVFRQLQQNPDQFKAYITRFVQGEPKPQEPFTLNPGDVRFDPTGKRIADNPKVDLPTDYTLGNQRFSGQTNRPIATAAPESTADQRNKIWVLRAGKPEFVLPSDVQPGDSPYDRTRGGNRPMLSSDAGKIADFDQAVQLLDEMGKQIGKTGAASKVGAMLPNVVTEYTGWGMDAKQRQGVIDKAKQIIGKTLEGGVLRKEDEYKYTKILPTIGDPGPVAASKLQGLTETITRNRQTFLDALGDAGFDIERTSERTPGMVRMMAPNGQTKMVPASEVEHYKSLGAKVMGGK